MKKAHLSIVVGALGVSLALAACSSSDSSSSSGGGSKEPIKIGVVTPITGQAAAGTQNSVKGAEARAKAFNDAGGLDGRMIQIVEGDDASSIDGVLSATKRLIDQEGVFGIIDTSPFFPGAYRYTLQKGVPVTGGSWNGPQWADPANVNLFSYNGTSYNPVPATTGFGEFVKAQGGTSVAVIGYGQSESSVNGAVNSAKSATAAGLATPYSNTSVPFGSVDFGAIALAMKDKGADSLFPALNINSNIAILSSAKQAGLALKVPVFPTGYGQTILDDKTTVATGEGAYFTTSVAPLELNTAATQEVAKNFAAVGLPGDPDFYPMSSYLAMDLMITGLQKIGPDGTQQDFIDQVRQIKDYNGAGVIGDPTKPIDLSLVPGDSPPGWCSYYLQLKAGKFVPVDGFSPQCGTTLAS